MRMSERIRLKAVHHPWVRDGLLALLLLGVATLISLKSSEQHAGASTPTVLAVQAALFSLLVFRTAAPVTVLALTTLGTAGLIWHLGGEAASPLVMAAGAAMVTVAGLGNRRRTLTCACCASAVIILAQAVAHGGLQIGAHIGTLLWVGFFASAGEAVQSKKAYVAEVEERARRAEHTREEEAGRRVAEERLRIAQELHDVVAHHIAVIHVQASVAEHLVTDNPAEAKEALTHVRRSSRTVLDELTGLLNVLRRPGDPKTPIEPAAGVGDLPELIRSFESSGLRVSWTVRGERRPLPPAVDLVAYRLVQEGLTNAHKHGSGSAGLDVRFAGDAVLIDIVNQNGVVAVPGTDQPDALLGGYGLIGMRERALAVGGSLRAAPEADGTWRVRAKLPVRPLPDASPASAAPAAEPVVTEPPARAAGCVDLSGLSGLSARLTSEARSRPQESV
ncbi:two-component sensor histidine kinase [Kineosporia sp. NBRC 101677]|uniref:sensor histidine kinase n=1 Tax=Kineosporia sp. NBRC 101677 TaxID=3032197 RepID=UPI0024A3666E|nr:histidine kinase [Kineosporia sp. NBRC 101677]GLY14359.1 two-component sensor histidine kinase [Kineosporia sp. NBRC 101677]